MPTDTVIERVADGFVFRRASEDRYVQVGGVGRGDAWAGNVCLVAGETPGSVALPDIGGVQTSQSPTPRRRFGPYWSRFLVLVRVSSDVVVAFGGSDEVAASDADWHLAATAMARRVPRVAPSKRLADELELLRAVRDVALIPRGGLHDVGDQLLVRSAMSLSCDVAGLVFPDGTVRTHVSPTAGVATDDARATVVRLAEAHPDAPTCVQEATTGAPPWLRSYVTRPVDGTATLILAHTAATPRGFTDLCLDVADAVAAAASPVLHAAAAGATAPGTDLQPDLVQPVLSAVLRTLLHLPPAQVDDGIDDVLRILGEALQLDRSYLFAIQGSTLNNTHEWCAPGITPEIDQLQGLPVEILDDWMVAFRRGHSVHVPDVAAMPDRQARLRALLQAQQVQSLLMVPTMFQGEVVGFVGLDAVRRRQTFDHETQALLALVADVLAAVDARRRASHRVALVEDRACELLRHTRDYLLIVDTSGHITWASQSFLQLGVPPDDLVGQRASDLTHPDDVEFVRQLTEMWLRSSRGGDLALPDHRTCVGDQTRWVSVVVRDARRRPGIEGLVVAAHDVTERREQTERLRHQALHDDLTGLPNRALLKDRLEVAMHRAARNGGRVGVLFLGLDGFKTVNDSRSHAVGDEMLRQIADRLRQTVRDAETAGRFGGDQFVVVIESDTVEAIHAAVSRVTSIFGAAFAIGGQSQTMSASFGLRVGEPGEVDPDAVLRDADNALFAAKSRGRGRLVAFDPMMRERAVRQDQVARRLPEAIARGEVAVRYQPIVDLATGRALGSEALARWAHPELGEVSPTEFIPVAEQSGLIGALGSHVLRTACLEAAVGWPPDVYVSVNLSPSQLEDADLATTVARALDTAGLPPGRLVLEVTESLLMRDTERSIDHLTRLRAMGIRIALDDFGTGHSSLAVLRDLPLDILKIDRSFVVRMQRDDRGARMVDGIVSLADDLGLVTVAEGVETTRQAARLQQAGCAFAQGWLFGHPVSAPSFPSVGTPRTPQGAIA